MSEENLVIIAISMEEAAESDAAAGVAAAEEQVDSILSVIKSVDGYQRVEG